jgi:hypothetical protein
VPDRLRLGFHAADGAEDADRAVEHAERTFDFPVKSTWPGVSMMLI